MEDPGLRQVLSHVEARGIDAVATVASALAPRPLPAAPIAADALPSRLRGLLPYFFHLEGDRPRRTRAIALDIGSIIRPTMTPDHVDALLKILGEKAKPS